MTQTAFQPLYGRFSVSEKEGGRREGWRGEPKSSTDLGADLQDIFGRKPATLFASIVFLLGSLACGLSKTYPQVCQPLPCCASVLRQESMDSLDPRYSRRILTRISSSAYRR